MSFTWYDPNEQMTYGKRGRGYSGLCSWQPRKAMDDYVACGFKVPFATDIHDLRRKMRHHISTAHMGQMTIDSAPLSEYPPY